MCDSRENKWTKVKLMFMDVLELLFIIISGNHSLNTTIRFYPRVLASVPTNSLFFFSVSKNNVTRRSVLLIQQSLELLISFHSSLHLLINLLQDRIEQEQEKNKNDTTFCPRRRRKNHWKRIFRQRSILFFLLSSRSFSQRPVECSAELVFVVSLLTWQTRFDWFHEKKETDSLSESLESSKKELLHLHRLFFSWEPLSPNIDTFVLFVF